MRRREFITLLGGAAAASAGPIAARAQQATMPVIGFLAATPQEFGGRLRSFHQGLEEIGFFEGRDVAIEYRYAGATQFDQLPALAAELVRRPVSVLIAGGIPAALAAKPATATIPIVFFVAGDPVKLQLVASLNRPGGNLTGVTSLGAELSAKRLELVSELLPRTTLVALLVNPSNPNTEAIIKDVQTAASSLGVQLSVLRAASVSEIETSFASASQLAAGALVVANDGLLVDQTEQIAALGLRYAVPTIFQSIEFATAGGLLSYGSNLASAYHQLGIYAGRILKGEKPRDLPVVQSAKIELIVNLKTAKALGLNVPNSLIGRADELIE
jgi:putative ABC transport system substrate-binding protein